jgi:hypothetical protein
MSENSNPNPFFLPPHGKLNCKQRCRFNDGQEVATFACPPPFAVQLVGVDNVAKVETEIRFGPNDDGMMLVGKEEDDDKFQFFFFGDVFDILL